MSVPWIKITTNIFDDEKIKLIDSMPEHDAILVIWIKLLTLAGKCNAKGCLLISESMPYTDDMLAAIFNRPVNLIRLSLDAFERLGMIERHSAIVLVNWEKHQNESAFETIRENERKRKQLQRASQKRLIGNVPDKSRTSPGQVPEMSRNVRILDIDIDKEKKIVDSDKSTRSANDYSESFLAFYESYPRKEGKSAAQKAYKRVVKTEVDYGSLLRALDVYKARLQQNGTETKFIKLPGTFLGCFSDYLEEPKTETPKKRVEEKCECCGAEGWMLDDFCRKCGHQRGTPVTEEQIEKGKLANG